MAVYERTYESYAGQLTPERWRFLVLPRYALHDVFKSKIFIAFIVACFIWPLVLAVGIYLPHNSTFTKTAETISGGTLSFRFQTSYYFWAFMIPQSALCFFMTLIIGPALVSADLRNNALPLYLARPFTRTEYILGKAAVLILFLSAISWIPGLLLFGLQAYLEGWAWFSANLRTGFSLFVGSWLWIILLCVISLALSAYLKWKPVTRAAMFGLFIVLSAISGIVNFLFGTEWGSVINVADMLALAWSQLFGLPHSQAVPGWAAWVSLFGFFAIGILILARKVRAYEVVK